MRSKRKKKYEQTEIFDTHKNILNNLIPDENILYQLKSYKRDFGTYYEYQLYITNKRICIIHYPNKSGEISQYISLDDLQGISFRKKKNVNDFGEIEFISEKFYDHYHSTFFTIHNNLSFIIKIIESILWHYSNVNNRIERLRNIEKVQLPIEFSDYFYNNRIIVLRGGFFKPIEFNQDLYITYSNDGDLLLKPSYDSKIQFIPKIKIRDKMSKYPLKELELIYFLSLYWKFKNNSLLTKEDLLELQKRFKKEEESSKKKKIVKGELEIKTCYKCGAELSSPYESCSICGVKQKVCLKKKKERIDIRKKLLKSERKRYFECTLKDTDWYKYSEVLDNRYKSYLNKDEKMLLYYKEKVFNRFALIIIFLTLFDIISLFLMIYSYFLTNYLILTIIFFLIFLVFIPCSIFSPFTFEFSFKSCLFTSQKIIFRKLRKIGTTHYNNFSSITYTSNKSTQNVYFHLKESMDSNDFKNKISFRLNFIPKKLNLYNKIIEIRNQFKT